MTRLKIKKSGKDFSQMIKDPESDLRGIETMNETLEITETAPEPVSSDVQDIIVETEPIPIDAIPEEPEQIEEPEIEIEITVEDCEMLYGVVMETGHSIIGTQKGKGHRELPEERRKAQGKILYNICKKYNIKIPTELELVIFGGAMIADWQYMTIKPDTETDIRTTGGIRTSNQDIP